MNTEQLVKQSQAHRRNIEGHLCILIGNNQMDVFPSSAGWTAPTRLRRKAGEWVYQQGPKVTLPLEISKVVV